MTLFYPTTSHNAGMGRGSSNAASFTDVYTVTTDIKESLNNLGAIICPCIQVENINIVASDTYHVTNIEFIVEYEVDDPKYTVTYNGNGATSGSVSSQSVAVGSDLTLRNNAYEKKYAVTLNPNYSGANSSVLYSTATFKGWEDRGNITASNGEYFTYTQFDAPYYANTYGDLSAAFGYNKLSLVNHYTDYGRNEGRSCTGTPRGIYPAGATVNTLSTVDNDTVPLYAQWSNMPSVTLSTPKRDGYNFLGWYTAASGGTKVNNSYVPSGNVTLYARWEESKINNLFIGTVQPKEIYIGTNPVKAIYIGTTKVYR